jgi:hypothetical protein
MPKRSPRPGPKTGRKTSARAKRPADGVGRRQSVWLKVLEQVGVRIDAATYARMASYLRRDHGRVQEVKRYYYIDLRGARGIARVEATLKGG